MLFSHISEKIFVNSLRSESCGGMSNALFSSGQERRVSFTANIRVAFALLLNFSKSPKMMEVFVF